MKKRVLSAILAMLFATLFCSCTDKYDEVVINDQASYDTIWTLSERRASDISDLFPESIDDKQVVNFNCTHTIYQVVGTGWQVELAVKYDNETFFIEKARLSELCKTSIVCGVSKYFDYSAYATVWNWNSCFEYAVINDKDNVISYIYLQLVSKDDIKITDDCIPNGYDIELPDTLSYSAYE